MSEDKTWKVKMGTGETVMVTADTEEHAASVAMGLRGGVVVSVKEYTPKEPAAPTETAMDQSAETMDQPTETADDGAAASAGADDA
jgi:hypothetical protein